MLKTAPDPIDIQDLQFKLRCRLKVFNNVEGANASKLCSLVTCASRFGLIFVGTNTPNVQVIQLKSIEGCTLGSGDKSDYPRRNLAVPSAPTHLSVNCEHTVLAIVVEKNNCPCVLFYDVKSFWQKDIKQIGEIRLSATPSVFVTEVNWNPALGPVFTACKSDGTLGIYEIKSSGIDINELPAAAGATSFCWSPKGKQIAVGSRDGKITQYKPDLKAVKVINAPPFKEPHSLLSLQWVSNYQFIGVFQPLNPSSPATFVVVDAPKTGDPIFINYDDICYSNGNARPAQFYTILIHQWNILMAASSNSMEVGILGNSGDCWKQWIMGDAARAELPLSTNRQETLPVGCGLDIGNTQHLPWGESTIPPVPFLVLLSHHGTLCIFNVINLKEGSPTICAPPDPVPDTSGLQNFIMETGIKETKVQPVPPLTPTSSVEPPKPAPVVVSTPTTTSFFKIQSNQATPPQAQINLFGGQATLTPVSKGAKSTPQPATSSPYQSLYPSQPSEIKSGTTETIQVVAKTIAPPISSATKTVEKTEDTINLDLKAEEEAEKIFAQMVREECVFLESELKAILHQGRTLKLNLGSDDDKTKIVLGTKSLEEFFNELVDICTTQNSEVHILKQNLLQSWAWYEEVKSRHLSSQDESLLVLMRAQPLDSVSEKQLADIRHANYYLESQISQAHSALDEQWENFQDYCKKKHKIQIPTMEMIFQTMVKQNAILQKQSYILKDIASRIKKKSRSAVGPSLLVPFDDVKDLSEDLKRLRMNPEDISQLQYEHVINRTKNFTKKKVQDLRTFLQKREYPHISFVKPQLASSVIQTPPKQLSRLPEKTSVAPRVLDFAQSTPKPTVLKFDSTATPIEGLQNLALKFEAKNFTNLPEKTFTPLTKNVIAGSPNSAFVSTSVSASANTYKPTFMAATTAVTASIIKTSPSFVAVTSTATMQAPKSFVNLSSQPVTSSTPKVGTNLFATSLPKTTFSFSLQTTSAAPILTSSAATTKPSTSISVFNLSTSVSTTAESTIFTKTSTPSFGIATTTAPTSTQFSFGGATNTSSIFGAATQKVTEAATSKTFTFSTKPVVTSATSTPNVVVSAVSPVASSTQRSIFPTTSVTTSPKTTQAVSSPVSIQPTFGVTAPNSVSTTSGTPSTQSSPFSLGALKSSIFPSPAVPAVTTTPKIATSAATVVTTAVTTTGVTAPVVTTVPSSTSIFSTPATTPSIFASPATTSTIFSSPATTSSIFSSPATTSSIFSSPATTSSIFGSIVSSTTQSPTISSAPPTTGFFGGALSTKPLFGGTEVSASKPSIFSSTTASSVFGAVATTDSNVSKPSIFGALPSSSTTASVFGTVASTDSNVSKPSIFGNVSSSTSPATVFGATTPTTQIFGGATPLSTSSFGAAATTQSSIFGSPTTPVFGTPVGTTQSTFASPTTTTQSQGFGLFGDAAQKPSLFNAKPNATQPSIFGSTQPSIFGGTTTSSTFGQSQPFDGSKNTSAFGQGSVFGSSGSTNVFGGSAPAFGQTGGSVFGNAPTTSSGSIFGATTTSGGTFGTSGSLFGAPASTAPSLFGAPASTTPSIFGSSNVFAPATTQSGTFGTNTSSGTFGFGSLNVSTTASSGFGAPANPFGGDKSVFGASPVSSSGSVFGSSGGSLFSNTSQSFGTGFGNQSSFGQQSSFFGGSSFGQQPAGPFSGGSGTVGQTGFGAGQSFQKPGFGAAPVFGGSPSFGSSPSFGGAPAFGSPPAFGNTSKVFGSSSPGFGAAASTQNTAFGNLANQPTVGFGNLAQQAANAPAQSAPFSGSSSFSSWR
ncbi:nuclear pore complex protein Nup214 [Tribolium castaneum]|uniref:Nucleoporin Nup159/Nup146 N-terminal domain-containing protein n=1 Tax=Tribolium castaneum TaxID=7070 RepID=D6WLF2_TRICA|nr:PREDICTED: nuclear pore complex protein Nup214 [Tribolium castaneum]EFA04104.2 hypothetical protein TcasGA2_TC014339 [Tribolium castaneum]|eukprot:XP_008193526.1 PREDICTED: nuclear pore complex protein Nup214 [Tribolium castaneum]